MKDTINIAFCGCGRIAVSHAKELVEIKGVRLAAYWNRSPEKAEALFNEFGGDYWTEDFEKIAQDPKIDAVYINTMHNDRLRFVKAFAESGKAVFSEKPLAHDAESLKDLHQAIKDTKSIFWSGYKIRFHSLFVKAMELMPKPEIISAHVYDERWPEGILQDPQIGGGNVLSQGVYATESARLLAGSRPCSVTAVGCYGRHRSDVIDSLCASYEFEDGAIASVTVSDAGVAPEGVSKFQVVAAGDNRCLTITDRFEKLCFRDGRNGTEETFEHKEDGFGKQSEAFLNAVRGGGPVISDFVEGAIPSIMIYRAVDAVVSGRKESIDIDAFFGN